MADHESTKKSIKEWATDDRPREKMLNKGKNALSDAELIAIILGSGNTKQSAVGLARDILDGVNGNLVELSNLSIADLMKYKGVGIAKAISVAAALELGKRVRLSKALQRPAVKNSKDAYEIFDTNITDHSREEFWIILLNQGNKVIKAECISKGGLSGTVADPKVIFKKALENNAAAIVLGHNHPSGETKPSQQDINLTNKLLQAGKSLEIRVLDHIVIGKNSYFSFTDEGLLTQ